ncbi:hypothetical protein P4U27_30085, partial [Bacillus mycoides]|nr:hypothetical protein [Bacillus mycoides]
FLPFMGAIVEHEVKGRYILVMTNMYRPLFFMTFYNLGLDNKLNNLIISVHVKFCSTYVYVLAFSTTIVVR